VASAKPAGVASRARISLAARPIALTRRRGSTEGGVTGDGPVYEKRVVEASDADGSD
jgi:hypothetical protein